MLSGSCRMLSQSIVNRPTQFAHCWLNPSLGCFLTNPPYKDQLSPLRGYKTLPHLMDFPLTVKPKLSHTIRWGGIFLLDLCFFFLCQCRNSFLARMLITPYFDPDFSMAEFKEGAKHAAVLIANSLAEGDLDQVPTLQSPWTCFFLLHRLLPLSHQSVSTCYRRTSGLETDHINFY